MSPSPPFLGSCKSSCKQGEVTTVAKGRSCYYMEAFIKTRHISAMKMEMLLQTVANMC